MLGLDGKLLEGCEIFYIVFLGYQFALPILDGLSRVLEYIFTMRIICMLNAKC